MSKRKYRQAKKLCAQNNSGWLPREEYFKLKKLGQLPWQKNKNLSKSAKPKRFKSSLAPKRKGKTLKALKNYIIYVRGEEMETLPAYSSYSAERTAKKKYQTGSILVSLIK